MLLIALLRPKALSNYRDDVERVRHIVNEPRQVEPIEEESQLRPEYRFKFVLMDDVTGVQLPVATDNIDKFTKTDMMKVVKAFKDGVAEEEKRLDEMRKTAEKELNESGISGDSTVGKRVRRSRKIRKP